MPIKNLVDLNVPPPKLPDVARFIAAAESLTIENGVDTLNAQEVRALVSTQIKDLTEQRMDITRPMDEAKKRVMDLFRAPVETLERALRIFDRKILDWDEAQQAERDRLQRQADADAETERQRLLAISDKAAEKGQDRKAETFQDRAQAVVAPTIQTDAPRAAGTSIRKTWDFEVTDASKVTRPFCKPDEVKIGKTIRAMGKEAQELVGSGVRIFEQRSVSSRRS
jgi:hypothetical protein